MKRLFLLLLIILCQHSFSQTTLKVGETLPNVTIINPNDESAIIPGLGTKVLVVYYNDPDVQNVNKPMSDAIKAKKYAKEKFVGVGIGNCADTWLPNSAIRYAARQKELEYPGSVILLDEEKIVSRAWQLGNCNDIAIVIIIGIDKKVKYVTAIKSEAESKAAIPAVLKIIEEEIAKL